MISRVSRSQLASLLYLRYRVGYLYAIVISLFVILVLLAWLAIAHVTRERREKAAGEVGVTIRRIHLHGCTAQLYRTAVNTSTAARDLSP